MLHHLLKLVIWQKDHCQTDSDLATENTPVYER